MVSEKPAIESGVLIVNATVNPMISESLAPRVEASVNPLQVITCIATIVWIIGVVAMFAYMLVSYLRIQRRVREAAHMQDKVWECDHIETPFILGVIRPRIYLPSVMEEQDRAYVIAHENAHLKRRDHLWKPLGFFLLTVYWFHPILWVAYMLLCRDIEMACDERVIKEMGIESKKPYSEALIHCSVSRRLIAACPLAFGEVGVKRRIKSVLNYKKPAFWIVAISIVICAAIAVCFLTNPKKEEKEGEQMVEGASPTVGEDGDITGATIVTGKQLTLEQLVAMSARGEQLTWTDFEEYAYVETGSGLYIRLYEIDEMFSVWIGGTMPEEEPWYIYLHASDAWDEQIDIRYEDCEAFIEEHKNNPVVEKNIACSLQCSLVGDARGALPDFLEIGGIPADFMMSSTQALPVIKITNVTELQEFKKKAEDTMDFSRSVSEMPSFHEVSAGYDEAYFEDTTLVLIYMSVDSEAYGHSVEYAMKSMGVLSLGIEKAAYGGAANTVEGCLLSIGVPKSQLRGVTTVEAVVSSERYLDRVHGNPEGVRYYTSSDSDEFVKPGFALFPDGTFSFMFSAISSYLGYGEYTLEDGRLTMKTYDGKYIYCFDAVGDTMIFDEEASSEALWYSGMYDGCVFK